MAAYGLSVVAGMLTALNPCVLPLLPIVLATSLRASPRGSVALMAGLVASFAVVGLSLTSLGFALDFNPLILRLGAGALLAASGVVMVFAPARMAFERVVTPFAGGAAALSARVSGEGLWGQAGVGALLGFIWTPCAGPTFGVAVSLSAQASTAPQAGLMFLLFGTGAALPLVALAYGSHRALAARQDRMRSVAAWARPVFGWVAIVTGVLVVTSWDRAIEAFLVNASPSWLIRFATQF